MRRLGLLSLVSIALGAVACQNSSPTIGSPELAAAPIPATASGSPHEVVAGLYEVRIDPLALQAEVTPLRSVESAPPAGMQYDLDISNFLDERGFIVTNVSLDNAGDFNVDFTHSHPFPAPDFSQPISATNRADLGYTGRAVILASSAPRSFFDGEVLIDPTIVKVADGFLDPGDLLQSDEVRLATAFPYVLLADEAEDNRVGLSLEEDTLGNYDPEIGGWQRDNIGENGDGWMGYDYVHQGQTVANRIRLYANGLGTQDFVLKIAILIQYTDPRGQSSRDRRFPSDPANPQDFAYRLPYSALDISKISTSANPMVIATFPVSNYAAASYSVRDWDSAAGEGSDSKVGDEADVTLVPPYTSGMPSARIDAPRVLEVPLNIPPHFSSGDGSPGSEISFQVVVRNDEAVSPAGIYWACIEVTDADETAPNTHLFHFGVDPETLVPDATRALVHRTWQVQPVRLEDQSPSIVSITPSGIVGTSGETVTFEAEADEYSPEMFWDFGDGASPELVEMVDATVTLGQPGTYTATVQGRNGYGYGEIRTFTYLVVWGLPEVTAVIPTGAVGASGTQVQFSADATNEPASWSWNFGGAAVPNTSIARDPLVRLGANGTYEGTVTVTNIAGESEAFPFAIVVGP